MFSVAHLLHDDVLNISFEPDLEFNVYNINWLAEWVKLYVSVFLSVLLFNEPMFVPAIFRCCDKDLAKSKSLLDFQFQSKAVILNVHFLSDLWKNISNYFYAKK